MMTADMDLIAPPRRSAASPVLDPRLDGALHGSGPHARTQPRPAPRPAPRRNRAPRRLGVGVLAGAATMLVVALLDTVAGAQVPVLGSLAALPAPVGQQEVIEAAPPPATPGTCLNWTRPDASDTAVVDCAQGHLFEQAGTVALADQRELPDDSRWRQLVRERCDPVVREYLGGRFDPDGRYRVGALKPSPVKWAAGDRELRCGLQSASRSGALYPMTGTAREQDQSAVHDPGTCLGIDGRTIADPVDCAAPHAVEAVGVVDLGAKFTEGFPAVDAQDEFLQTACAKTATTYAGSDDLIAEKKLTVYWDNLTEESWKAGTRRVNCNLAALLPDRSGFAPVTGSVRGPVTVGDTAAPPATDAPAPGVPAQVPPVAPPSPAPDAPTPSPTPAPTTEPDAPGTDGPPSDGGTTEPSPGEPGEPGEPGGTAEPGEPAEPPPGGSPRTPRLPEPPVAGTPNLPILEAGGGY